jgi:thiosulfate/3-mercaptopyruvate sulfurtransferase
MYSTLITAQELNASLASVVVIDCRFDLMRPDVGRELYLAGHIPGARYAHLDHDLSGPKTPFSGRHPLPEPSRLAAIFGRWGIADDTQVIVYDADTGMFASRLWWLLRWLGHRAVAVLDGGFKAWTKASLTVELVEPSPLEKHFNPHVDTGGVVTADNVATLVKRPDWRVLDARAPERFRGDVEPIDPVAGHIPGARNHPFSLNLTSDGYVLPRVDLAAKFAASLDGMLPERCVMMCGSGVTACHNILAMEVAGLPGAKLYAGSWSEWIRDSSRPVAKGGER